MSQNIFAPLKLFITGPTSLRPEVREAGLLPEFGHRDAENLLRFKPIMHWLKDIAGGATGYTPVIFNGSGTTAMEASIRSLVADGELVLNVSVGAFGDLYHDLALANAKRAEKLRFDSGTAIDLNILEDKLKQCRPAVVTFTHNETSTGVCNDIVAVSQLIRKHGALALADGVSIYGGADIELEKARPAMYVTATQKSLGLPAGFGIAFISEEAEEKAAQVHNKGYSSDLSKQLLFARKFQTITTPNCTLANMLYMQLEYIVCKEGIKQRFARHECMKKMVEEWVDTLTDFTLFAPQGYLSPTVTTIICPSYINAHMLKQEVKEQMRGRGYLMDPGYGKLNTILEQAERSPVFRIGHMGDTTPQALSQYLSELEVVLKNCQHKS